MNPSKGDFMSVSSALDIHSFKELWNPKGRFVAITAEAVEVAVTQGHPSFVGEK